MLKRGSWADRCGSLGWLGVKHALGVMQKSSLGEEFGVILGQA